MNVTTKIGVLVASALAISLLVQVVFVFPEIRSREFGLQQVRIQAGADTVASEITDFLDDIGYELEGLARMPEIKTMDVSQQEKLLSLSVHTSPMLQTVSIGIADINGVVTCLESLKPAVIFSKSKAVGMDISDRDYFECCVSTGATCCSDPFEETPCGLMMAAIAVPVWADDGGVGGVIFAEIPIQTLAGMIEKGHLGEAESVYMVDSEGFVIAESEKDLTRLSGGSFGLDYSSYSVVQGIMAGQSGVGEYEYDGETHLAAYAVIVPSGWGIVFQKPLEVVMAKSRVLPNFLLGINAAVFVTAVLVALVFARRLTNPIRKLADYAGMVERGDYTAALDVKGGDEIAHVSSTIKSMVRQMLAMREKELAAIVNSMKDGLITLDQKQRITRLNPYMEQMLGLRAAEVLNKTVSELEDDPRWAVVARLVQTESPDEEVVLAEPHERVVKVHSSKLKGGGDKDLGEVKVILDVTKGRELDQMKSDFIANTSHEVRTPLHSIRGFVKLMLDGKVTDPEIQHEFLSIIDEQSQHLSNLVSAILDTSAIESGEMTYAKQPVAMNDVIDKALVKLQSIAEEREIAVEADMPGTLPVVEGDSEKLEQVVTNLVHNAIKFSQKGGKVRVTAGPQNTSILVQVTDQGSGIPASAIPLLFQKFFRVHGSMPWASSGTGLGLYIVKQIVEAHGGQVWVESKLGEGSTFSFRLPLSGNDKNQ